MISEMQKPRPSGHRRRRGRPPPEPPPPELAPDDQRGAPGHVPGHSEESYPAVWAKDLHERLPQFTRDWLVQLPIVAPGATLEEGGIYLDLDHPGRGPFMATGSEEVRPGERYVAKRDTAREIWEELLRRPPAPELSGEGGSRRGRPGPGRRRP